jgi:hypothetical protein
MTYHHEHLLDHAAMPAICAVRAIQPTLEFRQKASPGSTTRGEDARSLRRKLRGCNYRRCCRLVA